MKLLFYMSLFLGLATSGCSTPTSSGNSYYGKVRASEYPYNYRNNKSVWAGYDGDYAYSERRRQDEKERFLREEQDRLRRLISEKDVQIAELRKELLELKDYLHKVLKEASSTSNKRKDSFDNNDNKKVYNSSEYKEQDWSVFIYASTNAESVYPIELTGIDVGNNSTYIQSIVEGSLEEEKKVEAQKPIIDQKEEKKIDKGTNLSNKKESAPSVSNSSAVESKKTLETSVVPKGKNEKEDYAKALQLVYAKKYKHARELFDAFMVKYPKSAMMPNVLYWKAETYYGEENYIDAITTFKLTVNDYEKSNKAPDALLKMIMSYVALQDTNNAEFYKKVLLEKYPKSLAVEKVKKLFF